MTLSEETAAAVPVAEPIQRRRRPLRPWILLGALVLAWAVPVLCYRTGTAVVLPFVFLALLASLLRSGRSILDRLVFAFTLTAGALCGVALLFSVWPWGLHPVPVAGLGFTVLLGCAALADRRPAISGTGGLSALFTVGIGAFTSALVVWPLLGRGFAGRLAHVVTAEDLARHFAIFEGIRFGGGYNFLHRSEVATIVTKDLVSYPQGSHLGLALFDNFLRSTTDPGPAQGELNRFIFYYAGMYMFMIVAVLWAIRWVAGPRLAPWRYLAVAGSAAAYLYFGDGTSMFLHGFLSEFAGLGLLAILVAVTVRPVHRLREQLCLSAALLIALGYTYYLFLPAGGLLVLAWVWRTRARLLRARLWAVGAITVTAVCSAVLPLVNWKYASNAEAINAPGGIDPVNRHLLMLLMFVLALCLIGRETLRRPERVMAALWLLVGGGTVGLMFVYQTALVGETSYYYEKLLHQLFVVGLVCLGATSLAAPDPVPAGGRPAFTRPLPAMVVTGCLVMAFVYNSGPDRQGGHPPARDRSWGTAYFIGKTDEPIFAQLVTATLDGMPNPGDRVNFLRMRGTWAGNYYSTLWVDVLARNLGTAWAVNPLSKAPQTTELLRTRITRDFADRRIRVVTDDPKTYDSIQLIRAENPGIGLELLFSNPTRCKLRFESVPPPAILASPYVPPKVPFPQNGCAGPSTERP
ncbi:hypothetical protein [Embleya hyalina]|uniref:Uncharacterized protein n=1 Tax=Embleya hyalina TaxID=516124 RepID=A0A401YI54_9ACTN|nr:hypothetical protein [Embleya hyalina]GCD94302.1 hypothetical protein EHYA_01962 [Embleya hyalina]